MNYKLAFAGVIVVGIIASLSNAFSSDGDKKPVEKTIFDFTINAISGKEINFKDFHGKYLLLVNTASKCGYTPQYSDLQKLHEQYPDKLVVIGFPANNFLWQEPGGNQAIEEFCKVNYGVTFLITEKISVKGGDRHPIYAWLESKTGKKPSWNFCKYLIDPTGNTVEFFPSKVNPLDKAITDKIKS